MKYFIKTFGCQQNEADSERMEAGFLARGMQKAQSYKTANYVAINTCMVRKSAEDRVYGLVKNLAKIKEEKNKKKELFKIMVTGCMVGAALRDNSGKYFKKIRRIMPQVDEFLPIEEVGFDLAPIRQNLNDISVPISNGCNNFCTFCIVPFSRGREISRPYEDIIKECSKITFKKNKKVTLLGQNVNSYGADLILGKDNIQVMRDINKTYFRPKKSTKKEVIIGERKLKPIFVKHLGKYRIPTLFPYLLDEVAKMGFAKVDFISSNPWDFSDELIEIIANNKNISRTLHLPVQSGDDNVLKRMNRWYTAKEYKALIGKIKKRISGIEFTTDIIVGFCGETDKEFQNSVKLAKEVGFKKAYIAMYTPRPLTAATKVFKDDIPGATKKERWQELEFSINKH